MIKISVITPVYNMENYIENAIESVLHQSIKELELICIDDGSIDNSAKIIEKYTKWDERVKLVRIANQGAGKARNLGIDIAQGEYIFFLDADDWLYDDYAFENLYLAAKQNDMDVCGGRIVRCIGDTCKLVSDRDIYGNEIFINNEVVEFKDYQCSYYYSRYIYKRKMLIENKLKFPDYKRYQDPPFFLNVMAHCLRFATVNRNIYCYRCAHKKIKWTKEKVTDLFYGVKDSMVMSQKMGWEHIYMTDLKKWSEHYINLAINARSYSVLEIAEGIINIIDDKILKNNGVKYEDICPDLNEIRQSIQSVIQYEEALLEKVTATKQIVLYGAGEIGKRMLNYLKEHVNTNIIGFAVSDGQNKNVSVDGVPVYYITELLKYKDSIEVIVTVNSKLQQEIENNLKLLGFQNITLLDKDKYFYLI